MRFLIRPAGLPLQLRALLASDASDFAIRTKTERQMRLAPYFFSCLHEGSRMRIFLESIPENKVPKIFSLFLLLFFSLLLPCTDFAKRFPCSKHILLAEVPVSKFLQNAEARGSYRFWFGCAQKSVQVPSAVRLSFCRVPLPSRSTAECQTQKFPLGIGFPHTSEHRGQEQRTAEVPFLFFFSSFSFLSSGVTKAGISLCQDTVSKCTASSSTDMQQRTRLLLLLLCIFL